MDIKIGDKSFKTRRPSDLDAALRAATGCNAAETAKQLGGWPSPGRVASALRPFLPEDAPSTPDVARMIAASENAPDVLVSVKKLYADAAVPAAKSTGSEA